MKSHSQSQSSKVIPAQSRFKTPATIDPDYFNSDFDVVKALTNDREQYSVGKDEHYGSVSCLGFPSICDDNIERISKQFTKGRRPGIHPVASACIYDGLEVISTNSNIVALLKLKERFRGIDVETDGDVASLVSAWFKNFYPNLPGGRRQNIKMPAEIYGTLATLSNDLGTKIHLLCTLAIMQCLLNQPCCNVDHGVEMAGYLDRFYRTASKRVRGIRAILDEFKL